MATIVKSVPQIPVNQGWITPEQQLERLCLPVAEEVAGLGVLPPDIAKMISQYATDESLTHWYRALKHLKVLPKEIPPLPWNIYQILDGKCPIYEKQKKADGTAYKIKDTHLLLLILEEFGTLSRLNKDVLEPYRDAKYPEDKVFQVSGLSQKSGDVPFAPTHWALMTNSVLPGTPNNKEWNKKVALINSLSKKAFVHYEIPSLQQMVTALVIQKVAKGKSFYKIPQVGEYNHHLFTYHGERVGCVVDVHPGKRYVVGIAAVRKLGV